MMMPLRSLLAFYVITCVTLSFLFGQISSSEPFVSLTFYGPRILQMNVKEYVFLGNSEVTVGCLVQDLPSTEISGLIYLYQDDVMLEKVELSNNNFQLIWNGPIFSFHSSFSCTVSLTTNVFAFNIVGSEVKLQSYSEENYVNELCLPEAGFLSNEVVLIACFYDRSNAKWSSEGDELLGEDDNRNIADTFYVTTNNILLKQEVIDVTCQRGSGPGRGDELCPLQLKPLSDYLNITFISNSFNKNTGSYPNVFTCYTNLPTDRISWRIDSTDGNILDFDHGVKYKLNFTITHGVYSSELTIETEVENVISVSCITSRSGYVAVATVYNDSSWNRGTPTPTAVTVPTPNISAAQNNSQLIIIIVILAVALFSVIFYLIFQKIRKSKGQVIGNGGVAMPKIDTPSNDNPYYYATSYDSQKENSVNKEGTKVGRRLVQDTQTKSVDHLTTDILEEGAEVTLNEAYQTT